MVRQNPTWGEVRVAWELALEPPRIATDRAGLLAARSQSQSRSFLRALDDLRTEPWQGHRGLRFRRRCDTPLAHSLHIRGDGGRKPQNLACECDISPHVVVDLAATP